MMMDIQGVGSNSYSASGQSQATGLEQQKVKVMKEIDRIKSDQKLSKEAKAKKLSALQKQLDAIEKQIANLKKSNKQAPNQAQDEQNESSKTKTGSLDLWT